MNKKFLSILTGVSALAVAGLLSIIPASVSHAAPSQAPATVNKTIYVEDWRSVNAAPVTSPLGTYVGCEFEYSYSGNATILGVYFGGFSFSVNDTTQTIQGNCSLTTTPAPNNNFDQADTIGGTFRFTYAGSNYVASINTSVEPTNSGWEGTFEFYEQGDYEVHPSSPSSSGDPAAKEFYAAIDNTVNAIGLAIQGFNADGTVNEARTVEYKSSGAINTRIIAALAKAENVTLIYTFEYQGIVFKSFITPEAAAAMYKEDILWYGPCYIAEFCPAVPVGFVE